MLESMQMQLLIIWLVMEMMFSPHTAQEIIIGELKIQVEEVHFTVKAMHMIIGTLLDLAQVCKCQPFLMVQTISIVQDH